MTDSRLPTPGGDNGNWGDILNDFLSQSHTDSGSLKPSAVVNAGAAKDDLSNVDPATARTSLGLGTSSMHAASDFVAKPTSGDATGSVPTKQSDGSISYVVPSGGGGGGGGGLDPAMPVPSTPFLFTRNGVGAVGWDGLDTDGNPMPAGFDRAILEQQAVIFGSYTITQQFDVSDGPAVDPATLTGFTESGTSQVADDGDGTFSLISDTNGDFLASLFGGTGIYAAVADAESPHCQVKLTGNVVSSGLSYTLLAFDDITSSTCSGIIVFNNSGSFQALTITNGNPGTSSSFTGSIDPAGTTYKFESGVVTVYDSTGTEIGHCSVTGTFSTQCGLAYYMNPTVGYEACSVSGAAETPGDWSEVGALSGGGAAWVAATGTLRLKAQNVSGTIGNPSATINISAYPTPVLPSVLGLSDTTFYSGPYDGQVLTFNGTSGKWQPETPTGGSGTVDSLDDVGDVAYNGTPNVGDVLTYNGGSWTNEPVAPQSEALADLTDVDVATTPPADGQILSWNTNDAKWVPITGNFAPAVSAMPQASSPGSSYAGGSVFVKWDGKDHISNAMPTGFDHIRAEFVVPTFTYGTDHALTVGSAGTWSQSGWSVIGGGTITSDGTALHSSTAGAIAPFAFTGSGHTVVAAVTDIGSTDQKLTLNAGVTEAFGVMRFTDNSAGTQASYIGIKVGGGSISIFPVVNGFALTVYNFAYNLPKNEILSFCLVGSNLFIVDAFGTTIEQYRPDTTLGRYPSTGTKAGFIVGNTTTDAYAEGVGTLSNLVVTPITSFTTDTYLPLGTLRAAGELAVDLLYTSEVRFVAVATDGTEGTPSDSSYVLGAHDESDIFPYVEDTIIGDNSANGADALPAKPAKWTRVMVGGVEYKLPLYVP